MTNCMMSTPITNATRLPLKSISTIDLGCVLVVAPHPDDETLGCGGAIAALRLLDYPVQVLVISDGTLSHPRSQKYPAAALRSLREQETIAALNCLGVSAEAVTFLRLPDGSISDHLTSDLTGTACCAYLQAVLPKTVFLPWRCDPHPDHRAAWQLIHQAISTLVLSPRIIEYPIWDWDPDQRETVNNSAKITGWRLNISTIVHLKQQAIAQYRSQTTNLIDDDPEGFRLTPEMLANFSHPWELYFEELL
ncbi:PIG-L family deacetylase [Cyanobacteria bacterium FACHB-63]|nr:PIG-L family deacetylase [Cyanobacteria bacterium FACHB-63]